MDPLELVKLTALMERTSGSPGVTIGLIDGPVVTQHPDLAGAHLREIPGKNGGTCTRANSTACLHGTFVAGILSAKRNSPAPAICPNCTLLIRPIFAETTSGSEQIPSAMPHELAAAIIDCIDAGARVINLSLGLAHPSTQGEQALDEALNHAVRRGVIVVAAAGNQGQNAAGYAPASCGNVVAVAAVDRNGGLTAYSNTGTQITVAAPGGIGTGADAILSSANSGTQSAASDIPSVYLSRQGTSLAAAQVSGIASLVLSVKPALAPSQVEDLIRNTVRAFPANTTA